MFKPSTSIGILERWNTGIVGLEGDFYAMGLL
jgi:hypothetical protein